MDKFITIKGARENNLKNIDLKIPRDQLVIMTGVSGSGKTSLAFDTIYAEGQRRYMESLSAYARQFLGNSENPMSIKSTAFRPQSLSTRRRHPTIRVPPSEPLRKFTIICGFYTPGSACRTVRNTESPSLDRQSRKWSIK